MLKGKVQSEVMMKVLILISIVSLLGVIFLSWYVFDEVEAKRLKTAGQDPEMVFGKNIVNNVAGLDADSLSQVEISGAASEEVSKVIKAVSQHLMFPDGEVTVATVQDIDSLQKENPQLYQFARNGDKVLFYTLGVVIYDPLADRIVDLQRVYPESLQGMRFNRSTP